jgi:hypothetical protein
MKWMAKFATLLLLSGGLLFGQRTGGGGTGTGGGGVQVTGSPAANDCAKFVDASTITTSGAACGGGGGSGTVTHTAGALTLNNFIFGNAGADIKDAGFSVVPVPSGGSGAATFTIHGVLLGNTVGAFNVTAAGATNTLLHGNTAADPTYSGVALADLTATGTPSATTFLRGDNTWATPAGSGTVTSIATTSPITGGTITTTGTIACATCVVATAPGVGIAHFAGATQTVTSSAVALGGADVSGQLPIGNVGSAGLSGTSPITISAAGAIACATCGVTGTGLQQFAATTSAQLAGVMSDETGTSLLVFNTSPTLVTPILGVATATSINKMAITAPATSSTLAVADGKTLTVSNTLTLAGTDASTITFPGAVAGILRETSGNTISAAELSGDCTTSGSNAVTCTKVNGGTVPASAFLIGTNASSQFIAAQPFIANAQTATYQVVAADFVGCVTIPVASGTFTVTLVASGSQPASGQCVRVINYGSGVVTVARSGQNINGAAANLTLAAGSASAPTGVWVISNGTDYIAQPLGASSGGSGTVTSIATTSPITGGTITTTGTIACATCATTTNGGALSGTAPVAVSAAGAISITGVAGQVLAGAGPAFTATPTLGTAGSVVGSIAFANTTSGSITLTPVTGTLGAVTVSLPAATGTIAVSANSPITESATGAVGCATCVTSAASLANGGIVLGTAGTQASATNTQLTFSAPTLTVGLAGTSSGILALTGSTSGSATLTAPAVAGTNSNAVVSSNQLNAPSLSTGTAPSCTAGTAGVLCQGEGTAPTAASAVGQIYTDSTTHTLMAQVNGGGPGMIMRTVPGFIRSTGLTAAVSTATLCAASAGACLQAGHYMVQWTFYESGTACGTPGTGGVTFLLTWTDANGTAHSAVSLPMDDATSLVATSGTFHFQSSLAAAWASGNFNIDTNGSIIQYATGYTACGVGTGTYALSASVARMQ